MNSLDENKKVYSSKIYFLDSTDKLMKAFFKYGEDQI